MRLHKVVRIENKTTVHDSFSVSVDLIEKLENSVAGSDELPVIQVELRGGSVKFLVIPDYYLEEILEGFRKAKEKD